MTTMPHAPDAQRRERRAHARDAIFTYQPVSSRDGATLNVFRARGGLGKPPLIFASAIGQPVDLFVPMATRLAEEFDVITWESRFVPSNPDEFDPARCDLGRQATDLLDVLDACEVPAGHVIGWCSGAQTALQAHRLESVRFRSLVLLNGSFALAGKVAANDYRWNMQKILPKVAGNRRMAETMWWMIQQGVWGTQEHEARIGTARETVSILVGTQDPLLMDIVITPMGSPELLHKFANTLVPFAFGEDHAWGTDVSVPTLILSTRTDQVANVEESLEIARRIPHARVITLEAGNHYNFHSDSAIWEIIATFVRAPGPAASASAA